MTSNFVLSTDLIEALFSGPSRLPSYYKKISKGYKRDESILHFVVILLGFVVGGILSYFALHFIAIYLAGMLNLRDHQWIVTTGFGMTCATVFSSLFFFLSKGCVDIHNIYKYGVSNSQYAPLSEAEIDLIISNARDDLVIRPEGVVRVHDVMVKLISAQRYKVERQKLKASHWEFRRGSISNAATMHPLMNDIVASSMDNDPLSRAFIRNRKMLSIVSGHINSGIACNTLRERLDTMQKSMETFLEELVLLQDTLEMATDGARMHDPPACIRRSISTLSVSSCSACASSSSTSSNRSGGGAGGSGGCGSGGCGSGGSGSGGGGGRSPIYAGVPPMLIDSNRPRPICNVLDGHPHGVEMIDMTGWTIGHPAYPRIDDDDTDSSGRDSLLSMDVDVEKGNKTRK